VLKVLFVVVLFAAVTYAVFRMMDRRHAPGTPSAGGGPSRSRGPARQVAPDDDEDFLRSLDRKRRKDPPA
jgi:hypothetical protein